MDTIEILVIDNIEDFATECVDFLEVTCQVGATMALTPDDAIKKMKENPIKIILLDYDMPVNGLELFPILKKIDPYVKIIFISSVATNKVLYESEKYSFSSRMSKATCYNELPELIPTLLLEYVKDTSKTSSEVFYTEKKRNLFFSHKTEYSIISYDIMDKKYIFPDSWHTSQMVMKGEKISQREEVDYERIFDFSESFKIESGFEIGLEKNEVIPFKSSLSNQLESTFDTNYTQKIRSAISWMKEITLDTDTNNREHELVSKYYDFANVYWEVRLRIKKTCSCCNQKSIIPISVYFPVPKISYRIREYYDNGETKTIDSGIYET